MDPGRGDRKRRDLWLTEDVPFRSECVASDQAGGMDRDHDRDHEKSGGELHGIIVQEGRAASGGQSRSLRSRIGDMARRWRGQSSTEHRGESGNQGVSAPGQRKGASLSGREPHEAIKAAIEAGKKYMSIEFRSLDERTTKLAASERF